MCLERKARALAIPPAELEDPFVQARRRHALSFHLSRCLRGAPEGLHGTGQVVLHLHVTESLEGSHALAFVGRAFDLLPDDLHQQRIVAECHRELLHLREGGLRQLVVREQRTVRKQRLRPTPELHLRSREAERESGAAFTGDEGARPYELGRERGLVGQRSEALDESVVHGEVLGRQVNELAERLHRAT